MNQNNLELALYEGNTYYFDLSDSSLYTDNTSANAHQLRFSTTSDGTHGGGVAFTDGVTESVITLIPIGTGFFYPDNCAIWYRHIILLLCKPCWYG